MVGGTGVGRDARVCIPYRDEGKSPGPAGPPSLTKEGMGVDGGGAGWSGVRPLRGRGVGGHKIRPYRDEGRGAGFGGVFLWC